MAARRPEFLSTCFLLVYRLFTIEGVPVATDRDQQCRGTPPERLVRQPTCQGVPRDALTPTPPAPVIGFAHPTRHHRTIRLQSLSDSDQTELLQAAERREIRTGEGSDPSISVKSGTTWRGSS